MALLEQRIDAANDFVAKRAAYQVAPRDGRVLGGGISYVDEPHLTYLKGRETVAIEKRLITPDGITTIVNHAREKGYLRDLLGMATQRIATETSAFKDAHEISQLTREIGVDGKPIDEAISETWGEPVYIGTTYVDGHYSHFNRSLRVSAPYPTHAELLTSLATTGRVPQAVIVGNHEWLHAAQMNLGNFYAPHELLEAHARRSEPLSHTEVPFEELVDDVVTSDPNTPLDVNKFHYAVWSIDRLLALGYSHEQIIQFIGDPGEWETQDGVWTNIHDRIVQGQRTHGINDEELTRMVMARDLKKRIAQEQARIITQEVMLDAYGTATRTQGQ